MQGKTFTQKNNYDVPYLKQPKSNPSLSHSYKSYETIQIS